MLAGRRRQRLAGPYLSTVRRHVKGKTFKRAAVEARGRKRVLSDRNFATVDRVREQLVTKAAAKLEVPLAASDVGRVRLYFSDGDDIDEVSLLEKDDTVFLAFDGGAWREASEELAVSSSSAVPEPPPPPP